MILNNKKATRKECGWLQGGEEKLSYAVCASSGEFSGVCVSHQHWRLQTMERKKKGWEDGFHNDSICRGDDTAISLIKT